MARKVQHSGLSNAKANKKDEFYTQLTDIERELKHYKQQFKGLSLIHISIELHNYRNDFCRRYYSRRKLYTKSTNCFV